MRPPPYLRGAVVTPENLKYKWERRPRPLKHLSLFPSITAGKEGNLLELGQGYATKKGNTMKFVGPAIVDQLTYFTKHRIFADMSFRFSVVSTPLTENLLFEKYLSHD
jgi:hypothetical protein